MQLTKFDIFELKNKLPILYTSDFWTNIARFWLNIFTKVSLCSN